MKDIIQVPTVDGVPASIEFITNYPNNYHPINTAKKIVDFLEARLPADVLGHICALFAITGSEVLFKIHSNPNPTNNQSGLDDFMRSINDVDLSEHDDESQG